jgi:protein involved in polysaccharide export with SLBB domain
VIRPIRLAVFSAVVAFLQPATLWLHAQNPAPSRTGQYETRSELAEQLRRAEAGSRPAEAFLLKQRLEKGDFQESDRILIVLQNVPTPADTYTVRAGRVLELPRFGEVSLQGVLRSELTDRLTTHLAQFIKEPVVRATPLVRIGILGRIGRPGYYYPAADVILSDVLMLSGGPTPDADLSRIIIRRGGDVIWSATDTRTALSDGLTLDRLHLRAGDEVEVGAKKNRSVTSLLPVVSAVSLIAGLLIRR